MLNGEAGQKPALLNSRCACSPKWCHPDYKCGGPSMWIGGKKKKSILQRKLGILNWFNEVVDQLHIPLGELLSAVLEQWREEGYITIDGTYSVYDWIKNSPHWCIPNHWIGGNQTQLTVPFLSCNQHCSTALSLGELSLAWSNATFLHCDLTDPPCNTDPELWASWIQ